MYEDMSDNFDRHAPEGYKILVQRRDNAPRDEVLRRVSKCYGIPPDRLVAQRGHFLDGRQFVPYGWMIFARTG